MKAPIQLAHWAQNSLSVCMAYASSVTGLGFNAEIQIIFETVVL